MLVPKKGVCCAAGVRGGPGAPPGGAARGAGHQRVENRLHLRRVFVVLQASVADLERRQAELRAEQGTKGLRTGCI